MDCRKAAAFFFFSRSEQPIKHGAQKRCRVAQLNFSMVFRDLADCRAQCMQAGRDWDLRKLSVHEVELLAEVLADPLVCCFPV